MVGVSTDWMASGAPYALEYGGLHLRPFPFAPQAFRHLLGLA